MFGESYEQILDMFKVIDKKLESPENIAKEVEKKYVEQKLKTMKNIYNITENFIIENKGVLYGGFALNALLPSDLKFYDDIALPDYDCFVTKANVKSKDLADILIAQKYSYTEVKHALHENTYKIFSNFESVADFTEMGKETMNVIREGSDIILHNNKKLMVCGKDLLKAFAYLELCLPLGASYRWVKVYKRLLIFENAFPIKKETTIDMSQQLTLFVLPKGFYSLYRDLKSYLESENVIFSGVYSLMEHLDVRVLKKQAKCMEVLSIHPEKHLQDVLDIIKQEASVDVKLVTNKKYPEIANVNIDIYVKNEKSKHYVKLLTIHDISNNCFSYFSVRKKRVTSIYYELYKLYLRRSLFKDTSGDPYINALTDKITTSKTGDIMNFTDNCYGPNKSMSAIKKSIWDNNKKIVFYRPK